MAKRIPSSRRCVIIGAGVHGLSTAYHLARLWRARGRGGGRDIIVVDKTGVAAGASGIACGVVRNNYFQPAMRELMMHSVSVWESDPRAYSYHSVGYVQLGPEAMREDVGRIAGEQEEVGYDSVFIEGEKNCSDYMKDMFDDWRSPGVSCCLHEKRGGYANNVKSMQGLAGKARAEGVEIAEGVAVQGFEFDNGGGAIRAVQTDHGAVRCDYAVIAAGPWTPRLWRMLGLPAKTAVRDGNGRMHEDVPMWKFWRLREGTLNVSPDSLRTRHGGFPPVIHLDSDAPLVADDDGGLLTDKPWGIYFKPDLYCDGVQGGAMPFPVEEEADKVRVDPYGPQSPDYVVGRPFARMWVSALAHCLPRFRGALPRYRDEPSGGIGAFTPDNFPIFDGALFDNCYVIADSNHGYKMIGIGQLVAEELCGTQSSLLQPFRFSRYAQGRLHPVSHSPFPWS